MSPIPGRLNFEFSAEPSKPSTRGFPKLTVAQKLPGGLDGEDWELMLSVCADQAGTARGQPTSAGEVLNFVLDAIRQADAKLA